MTFNYDPIPFAFAFAGSGFPKDFSSEASSTSALIRFLGSAKAAGISRPTLECCVPKKNYNYLQLLRLAQPSKCFDLPCVE